MLVGERRFRFALDKHTPTITALTWPVSTSLGVTVRRWRRVVLLGVPNSPRIGLAAWRVCG